MKINIAYKDVIVSVFLMVAVIVLRMYSLLPGFCTFTSLALPTCWHFGQAFMGYTVLLPLSYLFLNVAGLSSTCFYAPTIAGAWYFNSSRAVYQCLFLSLCIGLFVIHPVGWHSIAYAAYWLIPMAISLSNTQNIFFKSLGAVFTMHAVGSVCYLYLFSPKPSLFYALIPQVFFERLILASVMYMFHLCAGYAYSVLFCRYRTNATTDAFCAGVVEK